jgi:hypothetical protein
MPHSRIESNTSLNPSVGERRVTQALRPTSIIPTPLYEQAKSRKSRAERALYSIEEILTLMENPQIAWILKGKLARGGYHLMPENDHTPPEMASKLAYTELQVLRIRLVRLVKHPSVATPSNPDPLNCADFSASEDTNILHAIHREANNHLDEKPNDTMLLELKNLCQLAIGNLQQMQSPQRSLVLRMQEAYYH